MELMRIYHRIELTFWRLVIFMLENRRTLRKFGLPLAPVFLATCSVVLLYAGYSKLTPAYASDSIPPTRPALSALPSQPAPHNFLLIQVDQLDGPSPQLESIWLMVHLPPEYDLTFLPLYPAALRSASSLDSELEKAFGLTDDHTPTASFVKIVENLDIEWENVIVFDHTALSLVIERAGGVLVGSQPMGGEAAVAFAAATGTSSTEKLQHQIALLQGMCNGNIPFPGASVLARLVHNSPRHLSTDLTFEQVISAWRQMSARGSGPACRFPTLNPNNPVADRP